MSTRDPLSTYMEKRLRRARLALLRTLVGLVLGMIAGLYGGTMCWLAPIVYLVTYVASVYVGPWSKYLGPKENYTAGILSSPAALLLGYFLGSVI